MPVRSKSRWTTQTRPGYEQKPGQRTPSTSTHTAPPLDDEWGARTLHAVLGAPPRSTPVPAPAAGAWRNAQYRLRRALQEADLPPIRTPAALWSLLHNSTWFPSSWGDLCANFTMADVARPLLTARRQRPRGIFLWNLRYLKSTLSHNNHI